jgi:TatA/E family protein of Tat protein translocase
MGSNLLFFNISTGEIMIVILVVFVIFGPGKIPEIAKKLGRALYEVKQASSDIKREIDMEVRKTEQKESEPKTKETENPSPENK